jgi:CubicO group peptidase (beta-lactamase class C family)
LSGSAYPEGFERWLTRARAAFSLPGIAVVVVKDGQAETRTGGVKHLVSGGTVTADTLFAIGSNTKAMTAVALGLLVDDGRLGWDDPVRRHLSDFTMYDPLASAQITVGDLLVHRSGLGLGAGDLLVFPETDFTRDEIVRAIGRIKPATEFGGAYAYDNLLYIVAGAVVEAVSGQSWEAFVRERIFEPLGMAGAVPSGADLPLENLAWPHAKISTVLRGAGPSTPMERITDITAAAPAGGVYASANAMGRWLATALAGGAIPDAGRSLYSEAVARDLWTAAIDMPIDASVPGFEAVEPTAQAYALGVQVQTIQGRRIISHGGAIFGGVSHTLMVPDSGFGVAVMANTDGSLATRVIAYQLLAHHLGWPENDWIGAGAGYIKRQTAKAAALLAKAPPAVAFMALSSAVSDYTGAYADSWYGPATVLAVDGSLHLSLDRSPGLRGLLRPTGLDTFETAWIDPLSENAIVRFEREGGRVRRMTMKAASTFADFSFDFQDLDFVRRLEA